MPDDAPTICQPGDVWQIVGADVANRVGVGVELLPRFCDVTLKRWQRHHGAMPERNGEPVDFLAGDSS